MSNHYKSKKLWNKYLTRKDFRHENSYYNRNLKSFRKVGNGIVRRFKGKISDGGEYKKLYDLQWIAY